MRGWGLRQCHVRDLRLHVLDKLIELAWAISIDSCKRSDELHPPYRIYEGLDLVTTRPQPPQVSLAAEVEEDVSRTSHPLAK